MPRILDIELSEPQDEFLYSPAPFPALLGGVGSGKTYIGALKAFIRAASGKGKGMIVAPTYRMLRDSTLPTFVKLARPYIRKWDKGHGVIYLINGHEILYRSGLDPDLLRGPSLNWTWLDEGAYMSGYIWPVVLGRLREAVVAGNGAVLEPMGFVTCTPKGMNWLYEEWVKKGAKDSDHHLVHTSTYDNAANLRQQFLRSLERNYTGKYLAQEMHGQFVIFEGLIYSMFNEKIHLWIPSKHGALPTGSQVERYEYGLDTNFAEPCAITVHGVPVLKSGERPYDIQIAEWYVREASTNEIVAQFKKFYEVYGRGTIYADPSSPRLIEDLCKEGLDVVGANNKVEDGIRLEQDAWTVVSGQPGSFITPNCIHTMAELAAYHWMQKGRGPSATFLNKPVKVFDHLCDARRYRRMGGVHSGMFEGFVESEEMAWG